MIIFGSLFNIFKVSIGSSINFNNQIKLNLSKSLIHTEIEEHFFNFKSNFQQKKKTTKPTNHDLNLFLQFLKGMSIFVTMWHETNILETSYFLKNFQKHLWIKYKQIWYCFTNMRCGRIKLSIHCNPWMYTILVTCGFFSTYFKLGFNLNLKVVILQRTTYKVR